MRNNHKDLGIVKEREVITLSYTVDNIEEITLIESSCGCSVPKKVVETNQIIVKFTPDSIPFHMKEEGMYRTHKQIILNYKEGHQVLLSFEATVKSR